MKCWFRLLLSFPRKRHKAFFIGNKEMVIIILTLLVTLLWASLLNGSRPFLHFVTSNAKQHDTVIKYKTNECIHSHFMLKLMSRMQPSYSSGLDLRRPPSNGTIHFPDSYNHYTSIFHRKTITSMLTAQILSWSLGNGPRWPPSGKTISNIACCLNTKLYIGIVLYSVSILGR